MSSPAKYPIRTTNIRTQILSNIRTTDKPLSTTKRLLLYNVKFNRDPDEKPYVQMH